MRPICLIAFLSVVVLSACSNEMVPSGRLHLGDAEIGDAEMSGPDAGMASDADTTPDPDPMPDPDPDPDPTPDCPRVRVTTEGVTLNVRPDASTASDPVGALAPGTVVPVLSTVRGQVIEGNDVWYEIESGSIRGFISGRFAECTMEEPTFGSFDGYHLPLACGSRVRVSQGNNGTYSHRGTSAYAFDFSLGLDTPLHAVADGVVIGVKNDTGPGDPCYGGGGPECGPAANRVVVRHADGYASQYGHLNATRVTVGDTIRRGTVIGLSGSTGYSTGPHAHVQLQEICAGLSCQSVPMRFVDVAGDGVPSSGDYVTSMNCP